MPWAVTVKGSAGVVCASVPSVPWIMTVNIPADGLLNATVYGAPGDGAGICIGGATVHVAGASTVQVRSTPPTVPLDGFRAVNVPFHVTF